MGFASSYYIQNGHSASLEETEAAFHDLLSSIQKSAGGCADDIDNCTLCDAFLNVIGSYQSIISQSEFDKISGMYQQLIDAARLKGSRVLLSHLLSKKSDFLKDNGHLSEVLDTIDEAVEIMRELAANDPDRYFNDLAGAILDRAGIRDILGQFELMEQDIKESLDLFKQSAQKGSELSRHNVVVAECDLARFYDAKFGRFEDAEVAYSEAMSLASDLCKDSSATSYENLYCALDGIGFLHFRMYKYEDAENEIKAALSIARQLNEQIPDVYLSSVASSLMGLASVHYFTYRYYDAEKERRESLAIRKKLYELNPDANARDYSIALSNDAAMLFDSFHRYEEAEMEMKEVLGIRRQLVEKYPGAYSCRKDLADALSVNAILYSQWKKYEDCERCSTEALEIYRSLAEDGRGNFQVDIAKALFCLCASHVGLERFEEAEKDISEGLLLARQSGRMEHVSRGLSCLAYVHRMQKKYDKAEEEYIESISDARALVEKKASSRPLLADCLSGYAMDLKDLGRSDESKAAINEAISIYRALAAANPEVFFPKLENVLENAEEGKREKHDWRKVSYSEEYLKKIEELKRVIDDLKGLNEAKVEVSTIEAAFWTSPVSAYFPKENVTLSRLVITKDYKVLLPDYNKEITMERQQLALYLFFLKRHPGGYRDEELTKQNAADFLKYYNSDQIRGNRRVDPQADYIFGDSGKSQLRPVLSRVKRMFINSMIPELAKYYYIAPDENGVLKIALPPELIEVDVEL